MTLPRISTLAEEGLFQAAKWLKTQALLSGDELEKLLDSLAPFELFPLSGAYPLTELPTSIEKFVVTYRGWIEQLQQGTLPTDESMRPYKALLLTQVPDNVWLQAMPSGRYLVKPCGPFIQVQIHHMTYSSVDKSFRPMTLSADSIFWGLQFSFPQVYQDPKTQEFIEEEMGPNEDAFRVLRKWVREFTMATPMWVEGKRVNLPIRIGKECMPWINRHPQLQAKGIQVLEIPHAE
jgi:hypothetical protein